VLALVHVARYSARRYRLSRTRWRGIRLGQDGSTFAYLGLGIGWSLTQIATLGLATPWKRAALRGYIVRHSWFGDRRFGFAPRPLQLLPQWLAVMVLGLGPLLAFGALNADVLAQFFAQLAASAAGSDVTTGQPGASQPISVPLAHGWLLPAGGLLWAIAFVIYRVAEARMFAAATTLGAARLHSSLTSGIVIVVVSVFAVVVGAAVFLLLPLVWLFKGHVRAPAGPIVILCAALGAVSSIYYVCMNMLVKRTVLARFCETLRIDNLASLDDVRRSAMTSPQRGEGLADTFELGSD
jgi:uncharacterized membrane protein YjgN (DUF898 family)